VAKDLAQLAAVCRSGYYQLQATRHSPDLSTQAVKTLVQAFILWRLDYCNSPFYGITKGPMSRLQSVLNAAARLVSGAQRFDHITPVIQPTGGFSLPVRRRMDFKLATPWSTCQCPAWLQPPGHRLSVGLRRRSSLTAFCHIEDVCCQTDLQQL